MRLSISLSGASSPTSPAAGHGAAAALGLQCGRADEPGVSVLLGSPQVQLQAVSRRCRHWRLAAAATATGAAHPPPQTAGPRRRAHVRCRLPQPGPPQKYAPFYILFFIFSETPRCPAEGATNIFRPPWEGEVWLEAPPSKRKHEKFLFKRPTTELLLFLVFHRQNNLCIVEVCCHLSAWRCNEMRQSEFFRL